MPNYRDLGFGLKGWHCSELNCPHGFLDAVSSKQFLSDFSYHSLRQVHGGDIIELSKVESGDGWFFEGFENCFVIKTADCYPVILNSPKGSAVLHCGWRGVVAGIIENGCNLVGPGVAAIGPGISQSNFEVGIEVAQALSLDPKHYRPINGAKGFFNLRKLIEDRLKALGYEVFSTDICTYDSPLCPSHRKNGSKERLVTFVGELFPT